VGGERKNMIIRDKGSLHELNEEYIEYRNVIVNDFNRLKIIIENHKNNQNINSDIDYIIDRMKDDFTVEILDESFNLIQIEDDFIVIHFNEYDEVEDEFKIYKGIISRDWKKIVLDLKDKKVLYLINKDEIIEEELSFEQFIAENIMMEVDKKYIKRK